MDPLAEMSGLLLLDRPRQLMDRALGRSIPAGPDDPGIAGLRRHQPDARLPLARKTETLRATIRAFRDSGAEFVTLAEAAELLFQKPLKA